MEKFVFSILVNGAILYFCLFSTELMVLTHYYVLYMASYFLLFFFSRSVMWIGSKVTVTLQQTSQRLAPGMSI